MKRNFEFLLYKFYANYFLTYSCIKIYDKLFTNKESIKPLKIKT